MTAVAKGIGWALLALFVALALVVWWLDWNDFREPLADLAGRELGREVVIEGDLQVDLGWTPRIRIEGLRLADAPWSEHAYMAEAQAVEVSVPLGSVLRGNPEFRDVLVEAPYARLLRNAQGQANWDFIEEDPEDDPPNITALDIRDGRFEYHDAPLAAQIAGRIYTAEGATHVEAEGSYRDAPVKLVARAGALPDWLAADAPFPLEGELWYAGQFVGAQGQVDDPDQPMAGFTLDLSAEGADLGVLLQAFDLPAPDMNAFALSGRLRYADDTWQITRLGGNLGETRIADGELRASLGGEKPRVAGELHLARLDVEDLMEFFGVDEAPEMERERVFPDDPIPLDWLNAFQAEITLRTDDAALWVIEGQEMVIGLHLEDAVFRLDPVRMNLADGAIQGAFELQARNDVPDFTTDIRLGRASMQQLFQGSEVVEFVSGSLSGRIELRGRGESVAAALGNAEGQVGLSLVDGALDRMVAEGIALNILELLFGDGEPAQHLRCGVAAFNVSGGNMSSELIVVDTDERVIVGEGGIDLQRETLDFELNAHAKEGGSLSAQTPVNIEGTLLEPDFGIEAEELLARGAAALLLGAIAAPLAGILPFIEAGAAEDHDCQALIEETQALLAR